MKYVDLHPHCSRSGRGHAVFRDGSIDTLPARRQHRNPAHLDNAVAGVWPVVFHTHDDRAGAR